MYFQQAINIYRHKYENTYFRKYKNIQLSLLRFL